MAFKINFNQEKNELLKATRGVSFENVVSTINQNGLLADKKHSSHKFKHQRLYVVKINNYIYAVPYVINEKKREIFLKTIYPSRILTKKYLKGGKNEKTEN
jgi:hypothetical protein